MCAVLGKADPACAFISSPPRDSRILTYSSLPRRRRAAVCPQKRPKPTMSEQQEEITVTDSHAYTIKGKHLEKDGIEGKT